MKNQLNLYIEESKKNEDSSTVEMQLLAELTKVPAQKPTTVVEEKSDTKELEQAMQSISDVANDLLNAKNTPAPTTTPCVTPRKVVIRPARANTAHNWWLACIAFLLFLNLCFYESK